MKLLMVAAVSVALMGVCIGTRLLAETGDITPFAVSVVGLLALCILSSLVDWSE
jgi:hypothetical protein